MKVSIIGGGGAVGSTAAFVLAQKNITDEICLIDVRHNMTKDHEMDMGQAVSTLTKTRITSGGWEQLAGSDIIVLVVGGQATQPDRSGQPQAQTGIRMNEFKANLKIVTEISPYISQYAPQAIIVNGTNPVDVINSMVHRMTGIPANKVIGFSLNDSHRFRLFIAKVLNVDINSVRAMVLGEHGEEQCPITSQIYVNGEKIALSPEQKETVLSMTRNYIKEKVSLKTGRTSPWLSGVNIAYVIEAMLKETKEVLPCSTIDEEGISIGRAVVMNRQGIDTIVNVDMDEEELRQWQKARNKIADILRELESRINC